MTRVIDTADRYIALWNEPDPARRRALIDRDWTEQARYIDPLVAADTREGIARMIDGVSERFPGFRFALRGEPDGHGAYVRFSWTLSPPEAAPVAGGTDIARLDQDGRIAEVVGFLDGTFAHG